MCSTQAEYESPSATLSSLMALATRLGDSASNGRGGKQHQFLDPAVMVQNLLGEFATCRNTPSGNVLVQFRAECALQLLDGILLEALGVDGHAEGGQPHEFVIACCCIRKVRRHLGDKFLNPFHGFAVSDGTNIDRFCYWIGTFRAVFGT
ncbi:MAG: hypothetical protein JRM82_04340 [Nitrososphaerota archaeon]|nr:hypothetical protein [Nitrososphaerota archaeon]